MKSKKWIRKLLFGAAVCIFIVLILVIQTTGKQKDKKVRVGFIMSGSVEEKGWNGLHYQGVKKACDELELQLYVKENIKEHTGQCEEAIRELAEEKVNLIIMSSYGYAGEVSELVKEYPNITFYSESFDHGNDNMKSYFARVYQARYQAGIVAGMQTKSDCVGYVAAMANNEVNRGINAFTMGVKKVNPDAKVYVAWSGSWDDAQKEKNLATKLIEENKVDVITYHQNQPNVIEVAEKKGIASIGYHEPVEGASPNFLTTVEVYWDLIYKELVLDYMRGKSEVVNTYWLGMDKGAIGLAEFSSCVTAETKERVKEAQNDMLRGKDVFSGKIYDSQGKLRSKEGENISDDTLLTAFDWYVEGVEIYE